MKLITKQMVGLIKEQHQREKWGRDGHKHVDEVLDYIKTLGARSVLDYGCGRGTLRAALTTGGKKIKGRGWTGTVHQYDPAISKHSVARPADLVTCTDVLEHIEPELLDNVLAHILQNAGMGTYLIISTRKANRDLPDGRNAHLIIENAEWWLARLRAAGFNILRSEVRGSSLVVWSTKDV